MPKAITGEVRELVLQIKSFFEVEKQLNAPVVPFGNVYKRVAAATGFGVSTIAKIVKEGNLASETGTKLVTPGKKRIRTKGKIDVDDYAIGVIRRKVYEYYALKEEPSINKLLLALRQEINFKGGRETLRKLLLKIGFTFEKTVKNRKVLTERNDSSVIRAKYLQELRKNEVSQKQTNEPNLELTPQPVIIARAESDRIIVEHTPQEFQNTNTVYYEEILTTKSATDNLVSIMGNNSSSSDAVKRIPNTNFNKPEIHEWLTQNGIYYSPEMTKSHLLEIVKQNIPGTSVKLKNKNN